MSDEERDMPFTGHRPRKARAVMVSDEEEDAKKEQTAEETVVANAEQTLQTDEVSNVAPEPSKAADDVTGGEQMPEMEEHTSIVKEDSVDQEAEETDKDPATDIVAADSAIKSASDAVSESVKESVLEAESDVMADASADTEEIATKDMAESAATDASSAAHETEDGLKKVSAVPESSAEAASRAETVAAVCPASDDDDDQPLLAAGSEPDDDVPLLGQSEPASPAGADSDDESFLVKRSKAFSEDPDLTPYSGVASSRKRRRESDGSEDEGSDASDAAVLAGQQVQFSRVRDRRTKLIAQVLARWWYVLPPWPPVDFDYAAELANRRLKQVSFDDWETEDDVDGQNFTKVYEITHFPGMYRTPTGEVVDLRPEEGKPCFRNLSKYTDMELYEMLIVALKKQIEELDQSPYMISDGYVVNKLRDDLNREARIAAQHIGRLQATL